MKTTLFCLLALLPALSGCTSPHAGGPLLENDVWPFGEAIEIPPMANTPRLDSILGFEEWNGTARFEGNFTIADGGKADGTYAFEANLGHRAGWFYIAFVLPGVGENPYTRENGTNSVWLPDGLTILFTPGFDGPLTSPSDMKFFSNARQHGSTTDDGYWNGDEWVLQSESCRTDGPPWDEDAQHPAVRPWGRGGYDGDSIFWEIAIPQEPCKPQFDGIDFQTSQGFRMAFVFERITDWRHDEPSPDARGEFRSPHDSFPGNGYTPNGHYDPDGWLRARLVS